MASYLIPHWPAPANVKSVITTRQDGFSHGPWASFNLASHVGDSPEAVERNRFKLMSDWHQLHSPHWLEQTHSTTVIDLDGSPSPPLGVEGDASHTRLAGRPCVVMTADCLPVLFCDRHGQEVAAAHAGWRGLSAGILRNTVRALNSPTSEMMAYLGPAISAEQFEVGEEVRDHFSSHALGAKHAGKLVTCFSAGHSDGKLLADLYGLARLELTMLGLTAVFGGDLCTYRDTERFYSFRRDGVTGRMASVIWIEGQG